MTRAEAMRRIAALNRRSWLAANPGASLTDYQTGAIMGAFGMADEHWQGSSAEDAELAEQINAILAQIEE